jgi:hypothetical protein
MHEVYSYLISPGCLIQWASYDSDMELYDTPIYILQPMFGPATMNGGQCFVAENLDVDEIDNEVDLARLIYKTLKEKNHNAFSFYEFRILGIKRFLRYGSIKI